MKNILYTAICACSILCGAQAQTPGSEVPNLKKLYELTDSCDVNVRARFSPLIGISASISSGASRVGATYIQSIVKAGGTPIIIPAVTDGKVLRNIVSNLDGLVLIGGADVNPLWYEEEPREKLETNQDGYRSKYSRLRHMPGIATVECSVWRYALPRHPLTTWRSFCQA